MNLFVAIFLSISVWAAQFKGYEPSENEPLVYQESVHRFLERADEFYVLFSKHAAFYKFPRNIENKVEFVRFLRERIQTKKVLTVKVDPVTAQILEIRD